MPRPLHSATLWTRLQNSLPTPTTPTAAVLSSTPASSLLARLLPPHIPLLTPPNHSFLDLPNPIHTLSGSEHLKSAARWAIQNSVRDLILPTTRLDHAFTSLTTTATHANIGGSTTGVELLPPGCIRFHQPLLTVHEDVLDATSATTLPPPHPSFIRQAKQAFGDVEVSAILRHSRHKQDALDALHVDTTAILQDSIVEASHWGYVVAKRSTLASVFHDRRAAFCAVHALSRIVQHVSGSSSRLSVDDEQITRMAADLLNLKNGKLAPLPKGRTAAGVVVRPATGRFARRLSRNAPNDLMIFTREPDHESAGLYATRLRGNYACAPLVDGSLYWDNRFVIMAGSVADLSDEHPPLRDIDVLLAALGTQERIKESLKECELYVRQIRRVDWERITASATRVRDFQLPFQCIRALPAVFQKKPDSSEQGDLIASPHLGISGRSDLYFTSVFMPRFRSLPEAICPGFVEGGFGENHAQAL